jgi:drug/metabolite transporter (DMT)-like permease
MPVGLALGLVASLAWGFTDLTGALASRRVGSLGVLAGSQLTSLVMLVLVLVSGVASFGPEALPGFATGLVLGVGGAVAYLCFYTALRIGPISVVSPVIAAYGGATVVLSVVFRGESLLPAQALGAVVATVGVVLAGLVFDGSLRGTRIVGPGVLVALATTALFACLTVALAKPIQDHGWLPVMLGSRLSNTLVGVGLLGLALSSSRGRLRLLLGPTGGLDRTALILVAAAGALDFVAFVAYTIGLEVSFTWLVGLASSFGPAIAVLFAVARLGERLRPSQWIGLGLLAGGLITLAVAG